MALPDDPAERMHLPSGEEVPLRLPPPAPPLTPEEHDRLVDEWVERYGGEAPPGWTGYAPYEHDRSSEMLGVVVLACGLALFWLVVGLWIGWWLS
jgi:hypothetical protein